MDLSSFYRLEITSEPMGRIGLDDIKICPVLLHSGHCLWSVFAKVIFGLFYIIPHLKAQETMPSRFVLGQSLRSLAQNYFSPPSSWKVLIPVVRHQSPCLDHSSS